MPLLSRLGGSPRGEAGACIAIAAEALSPSGRRPPAAWTSAAPKDAPKPPPPPPPGPPQPAAKPKPALAILAPARVEPEAEVLSLTCAFPTAPLLTLLRESVKRWPPPPPPPPPPLPRRQDVVAPPCKGCCLFEVAGGPTAGEGADELTWSWSEADGTPWASGQV